jgi:hypothetical protein
MVLAVSLRVFFAFTINSSTVRVPSLSGFFFCGIGAFRRISHRTRGAFAPLSGVVQTRQPRGEAEGTVPLDYPRFLILALVMALMALMALAALVASASESKPM